MQTVEKNVRVMTRWSRHKATDRYAVRYTMTAEKKTYTRFIGTNRALSKWNVVLMLTSWDTDTVNQKKPYIVRAVPPSCSLYRISATPASTCTRPPNIRAMTNTPTLSISGICPTCAMPTVKAPTARPNKPMANTSIRRLAVSDLVMLSLYISLHSITPRRSGVLLPHLQTE